MAGKTHQRTISVIKRIFNEYSHRKGELELLEREDCFKLPDPNRGSKYVVEYRPDFIIKRNISGTKYEYIVFEVIDNQSIDKTTADIARLLARGNIKKVLFLICNGLNNKESKFEETERISKTLINSYKKRFNKKKTTDVLNLKSIQIYSKDNDEEIKKVILKEIKYLLPVTERRKTITSQSYIVTP
ncbi:MAG: hypothetical protein PHG85_04905 [Candidatus Altiarchaeota archaeon]|nr:hypothetical protein [Candidatus Altiarchaeota archaeon]